MIRRRATAIVSGGRLLHGWVRIGQCESMGGVRQLRKLNGLNAALRTAGAVNVNANYRGDRVERLNAPLRKRAVELMFSLCSRRDANARGHAELRYRLRAEGRAQTCTRTSPRIDRRRTLPRCQRCRGSPETARRSVAAVRGLAAASKRSFDPKLLSPGERNSAAGMTVALMVVKPRVSIVTHTRK
jgi:hypothetical protein